MSWRNGLASALGCLLIVACDGHREIEQESPETVVATDSQDPINAPVPPRPVRAGPPDFSIIEPELVRYADWFGHMTALQEQEALAKSDGPLDDFGRKMVGRTFRLTGRVNDVERTGDRIVVHLNYQPRGTSGRVRESGEALQGAFYSKEEFRKRRAWRLSIELPDDAATKQSAKQWSRNQWLAFDGRVKGTVGFHLKREGTKALFASNQQVVRVAATSGVVHGDFIGPDSRVAILVDASGSMMDAFPLVQVVASNLLTSLPDGASFGLAITHDGKDDGVIHEMSPVTTAHIAAARSTIDFAAPAGNAAMANALQNALSSRPTHLVCITDGDFNGDDANVQRVLRMHSETQCLFVLVPGSSSWDFVHHNGNVSAVEIVNDNQSPVRVLRGDGHFVQQILDEINAAMQNSRVVGQNH